MRNRFRDPRLIALVLIGALAIGAYAVGPAIGGGLFTKKKAVKLFYKKGEADARFAPLGSSYTKPESDARFLPGQSGETHVAISPRGWTSNGAAVESFGPASYSASNAGAMNVVIKNDPGNGLPTQLAGRPLRLTAVEFCYELAGGGVLDRLRVLGAGGDAADPVPTPTVLVDDGTNRTASECRRYSASGPAGGSAILALEATVDFSGTPATFAVGRTTAILTP